MILLTYTVVTGVLVILYAILIFYISSFAKHKPSVTSQSSPVSIVIACRNEEAHIEDCIHALYRQNYTASIEIIVIDDHSTDHTYDILSRLRDTYQDLIVLQNKGAGGKKHALSQAIASASHDFLLFTDADCLPTPEWIASMMSSPSKEAFKVGPVVFKDATSSILSYFQYLDSLNNLAFTNAGIKSKHFINANGANMGYPKAFFSRMDGFRSHMDYASGDDVFMAQLAHKDSEIELEFDYSKAALVYTYPEARLQDFMQQRKRWATKNKAYSTGLLTVIQGIVFILAAALIKGFVGAVIYPTLLMSASIAFVLKSIIDYFYLRKIAHDFTQEPIHLFKFMVCAVMYLPYILWMGVQSIIGGSYRWKDRQTS